MTDKTEALRLADALSNPIVEWVPSGPYGYTEPYYQISGGSCDLDQAASLLRSQTERIEVLEQALQQMLDGCEWKCIQGEWAWHTKQMASSAAMTAARAALEQSK